MLHIFLLKHMRSSISILADAMQQIWINSVIAESRFPMMVDEPRFFQHINQICPRNRE